MKQLFFILLSSLIFILPGCNQRKDFKITANIKGLDPGLRIDLVKVDFNKQVRYLDTVYSTLSKKDYFELSGTADDSTIIYRILIEKEEMQRFPMVVLENKDIQLKADILDLNHTQISGSKINEELYHIFSDYINAESHYQKLWQKYSEIRKAKDTMEVRRLKKVLKKHYKSIDSILNATPLKYKDSKAAPFFVLATSQTLRDVHNRIFQSFSNTVKKSYYGKILQQQLPFNWLGTKTDTISLKDRNEKIIHLDKNRGKYTIIDFWASWCRPCRESIQELKKHYAKYHSKGLNIYSISIDQHKKDWLEALDKEKMDWMNVWENPATKNSNLKRFKIEFIPHVLIIDEEGKIIAINPENKELEQFLKEKFD